MSYIEITQEEIVKGKSLIILSLNRADLHNAFNAEMIAELTSCFKRVGQQESVRALVLQGKGKSFCAGADLQWMKSMVNYDFEENRQDSLALFDMFKALAECPVPTLAKAHGHVFGGGLGLLAACDFVAAEKNTKFCFSEVKLGLVPAVISPFVSDRCSPSQVKEWMLTAKIFKTDEAEKGGLVNFSGTPEEVDQYVDQQLQAISTNGKEAVAATKKLLQAIRRADLKERRELTAEVIAERRVSAEGQEGLKSFLEKRRPNWIEGAEDATKDS